MPTPETAPGGPPRFPLGRLVATPAALAALVAANVSPYSLLARHGHQDWGDLDEHDRRENERALADGGRLLSSYRIKEGETVWILTEADRSATTVLTPDDY
jgi:hypothetical protein